MLLLLVPWHGRYNASRLPLGGERRDAGTGEATTSKMGLRQPQTTQLHLLAGRTQSRTFAPPPPLPIFRHSFISALNGLAA